MNIVRIALASLPFPATPEDSIRRVERAIADAAQAGADVVCFPECYVPGYRFVGKPVPPPDPVFLERAWSTIAAATARANIGVVLGTERVDEGRLLITVLVITRDGSRAGFQDKVQLDPSEEPVCSPGEQRRVFTSGAVTFGVAICHEGWRYPETVRWAARHGAQIVFHPHLHDQAGTFHEIAIQCRAAENTCYFASVNYKDVGAPLTSAVADPDGALVPCRSVGQDGLLVADIDVARATRLLATRFKPI
jgi:predicted amidohydrolase